MRLHFASKNCCTVPWINLDRNIVNGIFGDSQDVVTEKPYVMPEIVRENNISTASFLKTLNNTWYKCGLVPSRSRWMMGMG